MRGSSERGCRHTGVPGRRIAPLACGAASREGDAFIGKSVSDLEPCESTSLRPSAETLAVALEKLLMAGFSGLLSRLASQDVISLVWHSYAPCLIRFAWESGVSFRTALSAVREEELLEAGIGAGAGYQFLESGVPDHAMVGTDLALAVRDRHEQLEFVLTSASGRWDERTLQSWLDLLRGLLQAVINEPDTPLWVLPLLGERAILDFYEQLNQTASDYDTEAYVHDLIARQAGRNPEAIAVVFGGRSLTYHELEEQSTQRANSLMAMGAGSNRPVAICMERSEQLVVAVLAVLKSGSCYVPLDPQHPRKRIAATLEECEPIAVLSDSVVAPSLGEVPAPMLLIDEGWPTLEYSPPVAGSASATDLAYIIYTSGSTGKPKGRTDEAQVSGESVRSELGNAEFSDRDRLLAITTISFDMAAMDMLLPLCCGATLWLPIGTRLEIRSTWRTCSKSIMRHFSSRHPSRGGCWWIRGGRASAISRWLRVAKRCPGI